MNIILICCAVLILHLEAWAGEYPWFSLGKTDKVESLLQVETVKRISKTVVRASIYDRFNHKFIVGEKYCSHAISRYEFNCSNMSGKINSIVYYDKYNIVLDAMHFTDSEWRRAEPGSLNEAAIQKACSVAK